MCKPYIEELTFNAVKALACQMTEAVLYDMFDIDVGA